MKCVEIHPSKLKGEVNVPPSKSLAHRAVICAGFAEGVSYIKKLEFSKDITATCKGMQALGMQARNEQDMLMIDGRETFKENEEVEIDCSESGSTIRFLIPIAAVGGQKSTFTGRGKLVSRPLNIYYEIFNKQNIKYQNNEGKLPLTFEGKLKPGEFKVKGNVSSQFISGLMFALPLLEEDSKIIITTELESKGYVNLTLDTLNKFGIVIDNKDYKEFYIKGNQKYKARNYMVEGDFSQAAFWLAASLMGSQIKCKNLNLDSLQGDKAILPIIEAMGGSIYKDTNFIKAESSVTKGIVIDASQCPDLVPILTVIASISEGETRIVNAARLRIKECDRLLAISTELNKLGANIEEKEDGLTIKGVKSLKGGVVESWNDHRIAMALAIASTRCEDAVTIKDSECVQKSYPNFWDDFVKLGGELREWSLG